MFLKYKALHYIVAHVLSFNLHHFVGHTYFAVFRPERTEIPKK